MPSSQDRATLHRPPWSFPISERTNAGFIEDRLGRFKVGMLADVVLAAELENTEPGTIREVRSRLMVCDGRMVVKP